MKKLKLSRLYLTFPLKNKEVLSFDGVAQSTKPSTMLKGEQKRLGLFRPSSDILKMDKFLYQELFMSTHQYLISPH